MSPTGVAQVCNRREETDRGVRGPERLRGVRPTAGSAATKRAEGDLLLQALIKKVESDRNSLLRQGVVT